jgi:hypothetical protein
VPVLREAVRRQAGMFDAAADMAADAGTLQAALRSMARTMREQADMLADVADLSPLEYRTRLDLVSISLLAMTIDAGVHRWRDVSEKIHNAVRHNEGEQ